jgi:uncharacterized protein YkwD
MLSLNWLDWLILVIFACYAYVGYASGFIRAFLELIGIIFSFLLGLRFYELIAGILMQKFSLSQGFSNAIGFFAITLFCEIIVGILIRKFFSFDLPIFKKLNQMLGIFPGVVSAAILVAFVLILIVSLPLAAPVKQSVSNSKIGNYLLISAQGWEKQVHSVFGGAINETINFLTVKPEGNEIVALNYKTSDVAPDVSAEQYMFKLVNKERISRGLKEVIFDNELRDLGRRHCKDMFERGYFSHYTLNGFSPFDRMDEAGILYEFAGENLALSANTDIAMQGLMNSPGHKANILSTDFGRLGVGVIDGGIYGKMFCQEFIN